MLNTEQIKIVKSTAPVVKQYGTDVISAFYTNLLHDCPALKGVFNKANQDSGHQIKALASAVHAYAANIDNLEALGPAVEHITQKHVAFFVQPEQYAVVGQYLLQAFAQVLGDAFKPHIRDAWAAAYGDLADILIETEDKLYRQKAPWIDWRDFVVHDKIQESSEITSFVLTPVDKQPLPHHNPGQYISVKVGVPQLGHTQIRQYSLSDKPMHDSYRISVKKESGQHPGCPGLVSTRLHDVFKIGDVIKVSPPAGDFRLDDQTPIGAPIVFVSAGVGLTPLMAMLNAVVESDVVRPISWIHGARSADSRAFYQHVNVLAETHDNLRISFFVKNGSQIDEASKGTTHEGRVNLNKCDRDKDLFIKEADTRYFICGPASFIPEMQRKLLGYGVDAKRIKTEKFGVGGF